jgi:hypothetical protein
MVAPELLSAIGGFLLGVSITRVSTRFRTARLRARLEAAEFEAEQLRTEVSATHFEPR